MWKDTMNNKVVLLDDCQKPLSSYPSGGGAGAITIDNEIIKNGKQSIRLSPNAEANINVQLPINNNLGSGDWLSFLVYVNNVAVTNTLGFYVSNNNFAKFFFKGQNVEGLKVGWNHILIQKSEFKTTNGAVWGAVDKLQIRAAAGANQVFFCCIDSIYWMAKERPRLLLGFDDSFASIYDIVYPYAKERNLKGTLYALSGVSSNRYMRPSQLSTLYQEGWDICNHTNLHEDLSSLTLEEAKLTINTCKNWLLSHGFTRSANHLAYPINLPNSIAIQAALETGMLTARTIFGTRSYISQRKDYLEVPGRGVSKGIELSSILYDIDQLILRGGTYMFFAHDIAETEINANQWATSKMLSLLDYVSTQRDLGLLDIVTISEWYDIAKDTHSISNLVSTSGSMVAISMPTNNSNFTIDQVQIWKTQPTITQIRKVLNL